MELNPFIYGRALQAAEFMGRKRELRHLWGRLATGQSTAIIGAPHVGKTSLLNIINDPAARQSAVGNRFDNHLFHFLDGHMLRDISTQAAFWQQALYPLTQALPHTPYLAHVRDVYATAQSNQFGGFVLEQLFRALYQAGSRLVLLLDEFDDILEHSVLNRAEFYGTLRSLASRSQGLVLVLAARQPLERLNTLTQSINPHGSPYFNVFTEINLGPLAHKDLATLLAQAKDVFDGDDRRFVEQLSGRHPYLAQLAAAKLWDVVADGFEGDERYRLAAQAVYRETQLHFSDTWRVWTNETRRAITAVALQQLPYLVPDHTFDVGQLTKDLQDFTPELEGLEHEGWLEQGDEDRWQVTQHAFLWWLVDELWRNVRDTSDFQSWLQRQEMDGVTTRQQKEVMG